MDTMVTSTEDSSGYQVFGLLGVFSHLTHLGARLGTGEELEQELEEGVEGVRLLASLTVVGLVSLLTTFAVCLAARCLRRARLQPSSSADLLNQGEQGNAVWKPTFKLGPAVNLVEVDDELARKFRNLEI